MTKIFKHLKINGEFRTEHTSTLVIHITGQIITNYWNSYFVNFDRRDNISKYPYWQRNNDSSVREPDL